MVELAWGWRWCQWICDNGGGYGDCMVWTQWQQKWCRDDVNDIGNTMMDISMGSQGNGYRSIVQQKYQCGDDGGGREKTNSCYGGGDELMDNVVEDQDNGDIIMTWIGNDEGEGMETEEEAWVIEYCCTYKFKS